MLTGLVATYDVQSNITLSTEAIRKGTVFMNVFMQVIKSMEVALDRCRTNAANVVGAWDEAVAYYVGSVTIVDGADEGYFLYTTAEKRCNNFATCSDSGPANVNVEIMNLFQSGQDNLANRNCEPAAEAKSRISQLMTVPLIQGLLRDAYFVDKENIVDDRADASGAAYAAAVLPFVHACNQVDAETIFINMGLGQSEKPDFDAVKAAFERNYGCLGITCADIGGLLNPRTNGQSYFPDATPCQDFVETNPPTIVEATETTSSEAETEDPEPIIVVTAAPSASSTPNSCPPCASSSQLSATQSIDQCNDLVTDQIDTIPDSCECACFVDGQYAFCAEQDLLYTGSGLMVGPCTVTSAVETTEDNSSVETTETSASGNITDVPASNQTIVVEEEDDDVVDPEGELIGAESTPTTTDDETPVIAAAEESAAARPVVSLGVSTLLSLLGVLVIMGFVL